MKAICAILVLLGVTGSMAQSTRHTLGIIPMSTYLNKGTFVAHGIHYKLNFGKNRLFVETKGTLFKALDARKRRSSLDEYIPFFNHSSLSYERTFFTRQKEMHTNTFRVLIGYQFFQHGTQPELDYWYLEPLANNGIKVLTGFQTHSASVGTRWSNAKWRKSTEGTDAPIWRNTIEVNYLFGIGIQLKGLAQHSEGNEVIQIPNTYTFNRNGVSIAYTHDRYLTAQTRLFAKLELLYVPFIDYVPNDQLFIPRGGEAIFSFFPSVTIGLHLLKNA